MLAFGYFSNHEVLVATWAPHAVPSTAGMAGQTGGTAAHPADAAE